MTDDDLISRIIEREGGFVDHPADRGGPTRWGITLAVLSDWRKGKCDPIDVEKLSVTEAREIYRARFIVGPGFSKIGSEVLRAVLVDYAVNSGPWQAIKSLQRCLGVPVDGILGDETAQAANLKDGNRLSVRVLAQRIRLLGQIIRHDPKQAMFAEGWMNRCAEQLEGVA